MIRRRHIASRQPGWFACLAALLAPGPCAACGEDLAARAHAARCIRCWTSLPVRRGSGCSGCDLPSASAITPERCADCRALRRVFGSRTTFEQIVAAYTYEAPSIALHRALKFSGEDVLAKPLAIRMAIAWRLRGRFDPEIVVPVAGSLLRWPPSRRLTTTRLARHVAKRLGTRCDTAALTARWLRRSQTARPIAARRRGPFQTMRARRSRVSGRSVLIVDDVSTTGATIAESARALAAAGARRVAALVLARTPAAS